MFAANGSNEVLQTLCLAYGGPGRTAAVFEPTYALHSHIARVTGTGVATGERTDDLALDLDEVRRVIADASPEITFVCSPNNPTGMLEDEATVRTVLDLAPGLVVVDEAYGQFAPWSALELVADDRPLVVTRTYSKTWSMAAARLGYLIGPRALVAQLDQVVLPYHLDAVKQAAGRIALQFDDAMRSRVAALVEERGRLVARLSELPVTVWPSAANFVLFRPERPRRCRGVAGAPRSVRARPRLLVVASPRGLPAGHDRHPRPRTTPSSPPWRTPLHDTASAAKERTTKETSISVRLDIDGPTGAVSASTGLPFFDHMLDQLGRHGGFDLDVQATGDLHVDGHHTVEDVGITLGEVFREALGDKAGIRRFASGLYPLDEALVEVALDLSGRPFTAYDVPFGEVLPLGDPPFNPEMAEHFWQSFATAAGITLHVRLREGRNTHHIVEASFKGVARCLRDAVRVEGGGIPSTKGSCSDCSPAFPGHAGRAGPLLRWRSVARIGRGHP